MKKILLISYLVITLTGFTYQDSNFSNCIVFYDLHQNIIKDEIAQPIILTGGTECHDCVMNLGNFLDSIIQDANFLISVEKEDQQLINIQRIKYYTGKLALNTNKGLLHDLCNCDSLSRYPKLFFKNQFYEYNSLFNNDGTVKKLFVEDVLSSTHYKRNNYKSD